MRALIIGLALFAAACDGTVIVDGDNDGEGGGYRLEVRASEGEQTYAVTAPDGRVVAARAAGGASALLDRDGLRALAAAAPIETSAPEVMSLRLPGFEMSINARDDDASGDSGAVALSIGAEGQRIEVNAYEGGPGDADDRAHVLITGADEAAVRDFIRAADTLSPAVQAQMLAELGLD